MSFDWLNVPGLNFNNSSSNPHIQKDEPVPPSVSFSYNQPLNNNNQQQQTQKQPPMVIPKKNNPFANYMQNTTTTTNISTPLNQHLPQMANHLTTNIHTSIQNNPPTAIIPSNGSDNNHNTNNEESYIETTEDLQVPLSLSQVQLSHEEMRTYLRWYKYITTRTHGKLVRLNDVFKFLNNFDISEKLKERIFTIFRTCKNALNIGQFFAVLRLISLAVCRSILPTRRMILEKAAVPKPKPILNSQTDGEVYEEVDEEKEESNQNKGDDSKVDFDSFTSLLLTGKSTRKRIRRKIKNAAYRNKKVRFSEHITFQEPLQENTNDSGINDKKTDDNNLSEDGPLDLSLPMDQLLKLMAERKKRNTSLISEIPSEQQETEEEREELKDMQDSLSHFKQIRGPDSVSLIPPSYLGANGLMGISAQQVPLQPLKPTSTGSANHFMRQEYNTNFGSQDYASQQTMEPLKPTATGSANYLVRSQYSGNVSANIVNNTTATNSDSNFGNLIKNDNDTQSSAPSQYNNNISNTGNSNVPQIIEPLKPTATGSANYLMKKQINTINQMDMLPNESNTVLQDLFMNFPQYKTEMQEYSQNIQSSHPQQIRQQQIPTHPLTQQSTYGSNSYGALQSNQTSSPQHTMNNATNMLTQQSTYPVTDRTNSTYLSPQHTAQQQQFPPVNIATQGSFQNNNLLSASNIAGNYFQSLLSHTPSPNASNSTLPYQSNVSQLQPQPQQHQPTMTPANTIPSRIPQQNTFNNSPNILSQQIFNGSNNNNSNNGQFTYQLHNSTQPIQHTSNFGTNSQVLYNNQPQLPQQQQKQGVQYLGNPGSQQNQIQITNTIQQSNPHKTYLSNTVQPSAPAMSVSQQNTNQSQYLEAPNQLGIYSSKNNSNSLAITGQPNNSIPNASSSDTNILGNYQALQQQVNILQNRYR